MNISISNDAESGYSRMMSGALKQALVITVIYE